MNTIHKKRMIIIEILEKLNFKDFLLIYVKLILFYI